MGGDRRIVVRESGQNRTVVPSYRWKHEEERDSERESKMKGKYIIITKLYTAYRKLLGQNLQKA